VLHYLQSIQTGPFDLPLRPLTGASYQGGQCRPGEQRPQRRMVRDRARHGGVSHPASGLLLTPQPAE
jgi:hypothetical protein